MDINKHESKVEWGNNKKKRETFSKLLAQFEKLVNGISFKCNLSIRGAYRWKKSKRYADYWQN